MSYVLSRQLPVDITRLINFYNFDLYFKNHKNCFSEALTTIKLLGEHYEIARTIRPYNGGWVDASEWMDVFFGWTPHYHHPSTMLQAEEAIRNHRFRKLKKI